MPHIISSPVALFSRLAHYSRNELSLSLHIREAAFGVVVEVEVDREEFEYGSAGRDGGA